MGIAKLPSLKCYQTAMIIQWLNVKNHFLTVFFRKMSIFILFTIHQAIFTLHKRFLLSQTHFSLFVIKRMEPHVTHVIGTISFAADSTFFFCQKLSKKKLYLFKYFTIVIKNGRYISFWIENKSEFKSQEIDWQNVWRTK